MFYTLGYIDNDGLLHIIGQCWAPSPQEAVKRTVLHKVYRVIAWPSDNQATKER
jgi:hypothetical protein